MYRREQLEVRCTSWQDDDHIPSRYVIYVTRCDWPHDVRRQSPTKKYKKDNIIPQVSYSFRLQYHQCNQCDRALSNAWYRVVHLWQLLCTDCNGTPLPPFFCVRRRPTSPTANNSARHFRPACYVLLRREPEYASNQPTTHWRKNIS